MNIIPAVISQHAEEAAMLWLQRSDAVRAPHFDLLDLAKLDGRLEAHLDGLRIAGDEGWRVCQEQLSFEEGGEVFAAGVLVSHLNNAERIARLLEMVEKDPGLARALVSALGWIPWEKAQSCVQQWLLSDSALKQYVGLAASAVHRQDPGRALRQGLEAADQRLRARCLRAVGELGRKDLLGAVRSGLSEEDATIRFSAAWSSALLSGESGSLDVLRSAAEWPGRSGEKALQLAARRMDLPSAKSWQQSLARDPKTMRSAAQAAGHIGDPGLVPWVINQIKDPKLARVAGESISMITGVDIAYEDLEGEWPEGFEAGPTESPEDENVEMDPDEDLPWPEPKLVQKWWDGNRNRFQAGTRHLKGKPITVDWCQEVLVNGMQRQRAAAALELAIRSPGQPLFNVAAPGFRQQQMRGLK